MKRFLKKVGIMIGCLALFVMFDFFVIGSQFKYTYQASLIDKVNRLTSINEPKIILVGNSNVAFGFHSEEIEKEFGMPVVNLGFSASLGNAYHEQIAKLNINEGDIVVICHTSFSNEDEITDPLAAWVAYDLNKSLWPIFREKDYKTILPAYPSYWKKAFVRWISNSGNRVPEESHATHFAEEPYARCYFNEYGDIVCRPLEFQEDFAGYGARQASEIDDICINRLNELNKYCIEHGAAMVVAGYPIIYEQYVEPKQDFENFQEKLGTALDCDVISNYTDYFYPCDYFYDTSSHLTDEGAQTRTQQLICDLKRWNDAKQRGDNQ